MFVIIPTKKAKGLCVAYKCKSEHTKKDRFCTKHSKRYQKYTNLVGYTFSILRSNAAKRGIPFLITIQEFKAFCAENNYLENKGKTAKSASIDRIDPRKGYEIGNLQVLSLSDNSKKMHEDNACPF